MKRMLLHAMEKYRYYAILIVMALGATISASAQDSEVNTDINSVILAEGSMPITFDNDAENPWIVQTDSIIFAQKNESLQDLTSKISTTFTIDEVSIFSCQISSDNAVYGIYNHADVYIDKFIINGKPYSHADCYDSYEDYYNHREYTDWTIVLQPGTYTIDIQSNLAEETTRVKNVCLHQNWAEIRVSQPGYLGMTLLDVIGENFTQDAEFIKVIGSLNDDDWTTLGQLENVRAIDLTETGITSLPGSAFSYNTSMSTVLLPETLLSIGSRSFYNSNLVDIIIPNSVETIGTEAFESSTINYIHFKNDSNLKTIDDYCFEYCRFLQEFIMPNSIVNLGMYAFYGAERMKKILFSDNLTYLKSCVAEQCYSLEEIHFPINLRTIYGGAFRYTPLKNIDLPENLESIQSQAFYGAGIESLTIPASVRSIEDAFGSCNNLKNIIIESQDITLNSSFSGCSNIETITIKSPTPPTITNDPFPSVTKSKIKLAVPDFAYDTYRGHSKYWYQFTGAVADEDASIKDNWSITTDLTLDPDHIMRGTPSVEILQGAALTLDNDVTQDFNEFIYNNSESNAGSLISNSNNVTANNLTTRFYITANRWHFFSPVADINMSDVTFPATENWVIRYYDGAQRATNNSDSGNWKDVSTTDGVLKRGQGYIIQADAAGWLNMPVSADNQTAFFSAEQVTLSLDDNPSESEENAGWNFVANPYPCYFDIYYIDMQAPITVWTGSTYRAYSLNDDDRGDDTFVLRPMQPFFVQKSSEDLTTGMPLTGRRTSTVINRSGAPKREANANNPLRNLFNLQIIKSGNEEADDYTRIVLNEEASIEYERTCDASKFMSMDSNVAQLFSLGADNHPLAINERPYDNGIANLGVYVPSVEESYTITASRADRTAWLYDAETGIEHDLTQGDYTFFPVKPGYDYNRFSIRFIPTVSGVDSVESSSVKVIVGSETITVTAPEDAAVAVYATDGTLVATATGSAEVNVSAGVYVVKVNGETFKTIVK